MITMKLMKGILQKRKGTALHIHLLMVIMCFAIHIDVFAHNNTSSLEHTVVDTTDLNTNLQEQHNSNSSQNTLLEELKQTRAELEKQSQQKNTLGIIFIISILAVVILYLQCKHKKKSELKLQALNNEVLLKSQQLHQINEERNNIMRIIAHDLRSPISSFENLSKLILFYIHKNRTEDLKELMHDLDLSVHSLNNTLNNLLSLAFEDNDHLISSTELTPVNELFKDVNTMLQHKISNKKIQINHHIPGGSTLTINPEILKVVLRNILDNAIKFSNENATVDIYFMENDTQATLSIVDYGTGICPEKLSEIFVPYAHKQSTGTAGEKGLGVGLILSNKFISAYGGEISIKSELGKGTEVNIIIPKRENHENSDFSSGG